MSSIHQDIPDNGGNTASSPLDPTKSLPTFHTRRSRSSLSHIPLNSSQIQPFQCVPNLPSYDFHADHTVDPQILKYLRAYKQFLSTATTARVPSSNARGERSSKVRRQRHRFHTPTTFSTQHNFPDRYVPRRKSSRSLIKSFRINKSLDALSPAERKLRSNAANENPFSPRRASATQRRIRNERLNVSSSHSPRRSFRRGPLRARAASSSGNSNGVTSPASSLTGPLLALPDGADRVPRSGTNAPLFHADFFPQEPPSYARDRFDKRLAAALDIDRSTRLLQIAVPDVDRAIGDRRPCTTLTDQWWDNGHWAKSVTDPVLERESPVLDAPQMRDDFYCSALAFDTNTRTLAVGLGNRVYLWSEEVGVTPLTRSNDGQAGCYIGSLSFSSGNGGQSILAVGRSNGILSVWGLGEVGNSFRRSHPHGITCVSFKPVATFNKSTISGEATLTEELLAGDEKGCVYYYSVRWKASALSEGWNGEMKLLARIEIHSQQVCGIEWSADGRLFATGGNDNLCLLFDTEGLLEPVRLRRTNQPLGALYQHHKNDIRGGLSLSHPTSLLKTDQRSRSSTRAIVVEDNDSMLSFRLSSLTEITRSRDGIRVLSAGYESRRWVHTAAIKAIAFCPWQRGLLAVGGGTNDRSIHFYHIWSGACLARIDVLAQVTALIWSKTRREIVVTLGYCQPEHPYRIAVYSWPSCKQVLAIPWQGEARALYAIPYPGGPNDPKAPGCREGECWWKGTSEEGSIVVASSDESIKFHEVWSERSGRARSGPGGYGWSDILEGLEGVEKDGGTIR